ncbi:MAG: type II toxin-antitoxin system VapC family toxin [Methylobacteriaceae bacterium]|nr:type II toxin-antitoxin system VapC family toxin [Methylobacteriaceae bacterium]
MTALLLDSNAFLWWALEPDRLSRPAGIRLSQSGSTLTISAATVWELEIKRANGRLQLRSSIWDGLPAHGIQVLSIDTADALAATRLPAHHRDPFDRMIIAQAQRRGLTVVTHDREFEAYGLPILWA